MFYITEKGKNIEITPHNVKTLCAECNCQFNVDLGEVLGDDDNLNTRLLCRDCTAKLIEKTGGDVYALEDYNYYAKINAERKE